MPVRARIARVAVALAALTIAPAASAAQWGAPERGLGGSIVDLIVDRAGKHSVVTYDGVATRSRPGRWTRVTTPRASLGMRANGRGDVVTAAPTDSGAGLAVTFIAAGSRTPTTQVLTPAVDSGRLVALGIADSGVTVVAWVGGGTLWTATRHPDGRWDAAVAVPAPGAYPVAVAVNSAGGAVLAWLETTLTGDILRTVSRRTSGAGWETAPPVRPASALSIPMDGVATGIDSSGRAVIAWRELEPGRRYRLHVAERDAATGGWVDDALGRVHPVFSHPPSLDVSPTGHVIVAWEAPSGVDGPASRVRVRRRAPSGVWTAIETISPRNATARWPTAAISEDGSAIVGWWRGLRGAAGYQVAQAAIAPRGRSWAAPTDLSGAGYNVNDITVRIRDAQHAGATWGVTVGPGLVTIRFFTDFSPTAVPPARPRVTIRRVVTDRGPGSLPTPEARVHVGVTLNRFVERFPAVVERRAAAGWVLVRRVWLTTSQQQTAGVLLRPTSPGRYRIRLLQGAPQSSHEFTVGRIPKSRGLAPCLRPLRAVAVEQTAWVTCERDDGRIVLQRADLARARMSTVAVPVGSADDGPPQLAITADTVWVLRNATLMPIDRATGQRGRPIPVDPEGTFPGLAPLMAAGYDQVAILKGGVLTRVDATTRAVISSVALPDADPTSYDVSLAVGPSGVWVARRTGLTGSWAHFNVRATGVERRAGNGLVRTGPGGVWELGPIYDNGLRGVRRVDPPSPDQVTDLSPLHLYDLVGDATTLWGVSYRHEEACGGICRMDIYPIDPATGRQAGPPIRRNIPLHRLDTVLPVPGGLWVLSDRLIRVR